MIPSPWVFTLLALAAWRTWWLLARDVILEPLRDPVYDRFENVAVFGYCPFCFGAWVAAGWWAAWYFASDKWTEVAAVPFALSAVVAVAGVLVSHLVDD